MIASFLLSFYYAKVYFAAVNPIDTSILASIEAKATAIVAYAKHMVELYNNQITAVNNVFKAADQNKTIYGNDGFD